MGNWIIVAIPGIVLIVLFIITILLKSTELPLGTRPDPTTKRPELPIISENRVICSYCRMPQPKDWDSCDCRQCGAPLEVK